MRCLIMIPFIFIFIQPVSAALKKCIDDEGKFHYYNNILPPECQGRATVEMNKLGVVIRKNEVEEVSSSLSEEDKAALMAVEQKLADEKRRDTVLLNTYTSAQEIDLARERNLHPVALAIIGAEKRLEISRARLGDLQAQAEVAEQAESPILAAIKEDIVPAQRDVANLKNEMMEHQRRMESIKARFDTDKKRFLELMEQKP